MSASSSSSADVTTNNCDIISLLIGEDEEKWRNTKGQLAYINQLIEKGETPKEILKKYFGIDILEGHEEVELWSILYHLMTDGFARSRLESINTFDQALDLINTKSKIMILTGAGISVPCGVPDFRSRNGIYARLAKDYPDLDEPQSMFDIKYFVKNPKPFFKFAKEIYPGNFQPSFGHKFIKLLESKNKLLRNYTQNIDTIEMITGIKNIIQCHGSFSTATCMRCENKVTCDEIKDKIMSNEIPICTNCTVESERDIDWLLNKISETESEENPYSDGLIPIIKPDIVFFGEGLPKNFHSTLADDKDDVDLLIVIGSSLKVKPVAHIPSCLPPHVPQILINKEPLSNHRFDVELFGDCDEIVWEICSSLNWLEHLDNNSSSDITSSETIIKPLEDMKEEIKNLVDEASEESDGEKISVENNIVYISVADLLKKELKAIRIPPNRYVFRGAEYFVNGDSLEELRYPNVFGDDSDDSITSEEEDDEDEDGDGDGDGDDKINGDDNEEDHKNDKINGDDINKNNGDVANSESNLSPLKRILGDDENKTNECKKMKTNEEDKEDSSVVDNN